MSNQHELRWFHVILTSYGAWLPVDPRGFRTRDHRDHVEGDYKHPPEPGLYDGLHRASLQNQKQPTFTISHELRPVIADALWDKLERLGALLAILAVAGRHVHIPAKSPPRQTRAWIGHAKRHVTFTLRERGIARKVWAGGGKFKPIRDRPHQLNVYKYIAAHADEGAFVIKAAERGAESASDATENR